MICYCYDNSTPFGPTLLIAMPSDNLVNYVAAVEGIDRSSFKDDGERSEALRVAYALVARLESPWETVARIVMTEVTEISRFSSSYYLHSLQYPHQNGPYPSGIEC